MEKGESGILVTEEIIISNIYLIRGKKVMLDRDLASLYGVETKALKQAIRRNIRRFPIDFMFEMSVEEFQNWRSQFVTSNSEKMGLRYPPFCFTEHGIIMLASILNSVRAVEINVQIVRIFIKMRELISSHKEILQKLTELEKKDIEHDEKILLIFKYLKQLKEEKVEENRFRQRPGIGFKQGG